jgi:hypothetical protein
MFFPVTDLIFDHFPTVKKKTGDKVAFLQFVQNGDCLTLKTGMEPCGQFFHGTDPLTGIYCIADTVYAEIGGTEICVVAKYRIIKKTGAPACANASVCH